MTRARDRAPARAGVLWMAATLAGLAVATAVVVVPQSPSVTAAAAPRPPARVQGSTASPSASASPAPSIQIEAAHSASFVPALEGGRPMFILALGSDARPGLRGARADSIHLIGLDLERERATILGFPRDSWVPIPGFGTDRINTALSLGGPELVVRTIEKLTGIRVDFWMLTGFTGLQSMVNGIGGLSVRVTTPMHDPLSGSDFDPGLRHLNGSQALSFARDRHSLERGDIDRSANQGRLLLSALGQLNRSFQGDPSVVFRWITLGWGNVKTDLSVATLLDLGLTAAQISPARVTNLVVPSSVGTAGPFSVVFISSSAEALYADLRADGYADRRPSR